MTPRVLILGGTGEGRRLAANLTGENVRVTSSLAGRVGDPQLPHGDVRVGGFGGVDGLADWLRRERVDALVDATHPFARNMTDNAVRAAERTTTPVLLLRRAAWQPCSGDDWRPVPTLRDAAALIPDLGERILLTTGRQGLEHFAGLEEPWFLVRAVDPPQPPLPPRTTTLLERGPFTVDGERALMREYGVDVLVTKNSGGTMTAAKLTAARELGLPVVMVQRPPSPPAAEVDTVEGAVSWLRTRLGPDHAG